MAHVLSVLLRARRRSAVVILLIAFLIMLLLLWKGIATAGTVDAQAIGFSHRAHVSAGVPCLFCHPGAISGDYASIPSLAKCMGCHQNIQVTTQAGQAGVDLLKQAYAQGQPLRWPRVYDLPDFVRFTHRPHIAAGLHCESCHGDVSSMDMARPAYRLNMGFCLHCHRQQPAARARLLDNCGTCHR